MKNILITTILFLNACLIFAQTGYEYDNLNRLTKVTYDNGTTISYNYDELGNRQKKTVVASSTVYNLSVSKTTIDFNADSGTNTFDITSNTTWTVSSSDSWATVDVSSGSDNATITVSASANTASSPRTATITVTGGGITKTVSVTQAEENQTPPPAQLNVSVTYFDFSSNSGTNTFDITSNAAWTISSPASWVTVNITSGSGNATITVAVSKNTTSSTRTATITITNGDITKTLSVSQDGESTPFNFTVSPSSINVKEYGNESFRITTSKDWTVSCQSDWILFIENSGNTDKETTVIFNFYVQQNSTSEARTAEIKVSSGGITKTVTVTQNAASEKKIIATPSKPADNKGTIDLSLDFPSDKTLTGVFTVTMPDGFILDKENTVLSQELQHNHSLVISDKEKGVWTLNISPKTSTRSSSNTTYTKIVEIAYIIEDNAAAGLYNVIISNLEFTTSDNTTIKEDDISVGVTHTSSVGNLSVNDAVKVTYYNNTLYINSPQGERVNIYSMTGMLVFSQQKPEGEIKYNISELSTGVIIVKGSSGWVEKLIKK